MLFLELVFERKNSVVALIHYEPLFQITCIATQGKTLCTRSKTKKWETRVIPETIPLLNEGNLFRESVSVTYQVEFLRIPKNLNYALSLEHSLSELLSDHCYYNTIKYLRFKYHQSRYFIVLFSSDSIIFTVNPSQDENNGCFQLDGGHTRIDRMMNHKLR